MSDQTCLHCKAELDIPKAYACQTVACPSCGKPLDILADGSIRQPDTRPAWRRVEASSAPAPDPVFAQICRHSERAARSLQEIRDLIAAQMILFAIVCVVFGAIVCWRAFT